MRQSWKDGSAAVTSALTQQYNRRSRSASGSHFRNRICSSHFRDSIGSSAIPRRTALTAAFAVLTVEEKGFDLRHFATRFRRRRCHFRHRLRRRRLRRLRRYLRRRLRLRRSPRGREGRGKGARRISRGGGVGSCVVSGSDFCNGAIFAFAVGIRVGRWRVVGLVGVFLVALRVDD